MIMAEHIAWSIIQALEERGECPICGHMNHEHHETCSRFLGKDEVYCYYCRKIHSINGDR